MPPSTAETTSGTASLVSLLGDQRAAIVRRLRAEGDHTVAQLADHLGISEVATRRHLRRLEEDDFIDARTVNEGRGRPAAHYRLTARARDLFPHRYAEVADELLEFVTSEHGREGLRRYLRWRLERQADRFQEAVTADDLETRLEQLAAVLTSAGFEATVTRDGDGFRLTQTHCAIEDVARDHPELCAYEAAGFSRALGSDVTLSRRKTLADGHRACVCEVRPRDGADDREQAATTTDGTPPTRTTRPSDTDPTTQERT